MQDSNLTDRELLLAVDNDPNATPRELEHIRMLREALADAIVCVQDWSAYVAPYYLERHDLHGDVKRLRAVLEATK